MFLTWQVNTFRVIVEWNCHVIMYLSLKLYVSWVKQLYPIIFHQSLEFQFGPKGKSSTDKEWIVSHEGEMNSTALWFFFLPLYCHPATGPVRSSQTAARNHPPVQRATRVDRTAHLPVASNTRTHRRAPQSSSGPRQPERAFAGTPLLERRRQHHTKPQSDQRNRNAAKLSKRTHTRNTFRHHINKIKL